MLTMTLNKVVYDEIPINNIAPLYTESVSKKKVTALTKQLQRNELVSVLMVEQDNDNNCYWLVGGFTAYMVYRDNEVERVPCLIRQKTNLLARRIALLKHMFFVQTTKWHDKHKVIMDLLETNQSVGDIAKKLGYSESDLNDYLIDQSIPEYFVTKAKENKSSFILLKKVANLACSLSIKNELFERITIPGRQHPEKLTHDRFQKLKWLFNRENFYELNELDQLFLINKDVIHYQEVLKKIMDEDIRDTLIDKT
jgi:hypothetical protein